MAPKITTVNRLEDVSLIEAGLDLISGRKPPLAVLTESQEPARARGEVVSSIDNDLEGRVAGLRCWDVLLLSVFSARAAILGAQGNRASVVPFLAVLSTRLKRRSSQGLQTLLGDSQAALYDELPAVFFSLACTSVLQTARKEASRTTPWPPRGALNKHKRGQIQIHCVSFGL